MTHLDDTAEFESFSKESLERIQAEALQREAMYDAIDKELKHAEDHPFMFLIKVFWKSLKGPLSLGERRFAVALVIMTAIAAFSIGNLARAQDELAVNAIVQEKLIEHIQLTEKELAFKKAQVIQLAVGLNKAQREKVFYKTKLASYQDDWYYIAKEWTVETAHSIAVSTPVKTVESWATSAGDWMSSLITTTESPVNVRTERAVAESAG